MSSTVIEVRTDLVRMACDECMNFVSKHRNEIRESLIKDLTRPRLFRKPVDREEAMGILRKRLRSPYYSSDWFNAYSNEMARAVDLKSASLSCCSETMALSVDDAKFVTRFSIKHVLVNDIKRGEHIGAATYTGTYTGTYAQPCTSRATNET